MPYLVILAAGFAAGWFAHALRERRSTPRKRSRAIPKGTEPKKGPGRPRKPKEAPEPPPALDMTPD